MSPRSTRVFPLSDGEGGFRPAGHDEQQLEKAHVTVRKVLGRGEPRNNGDEG